VKINRKVTREANRRENGRDTLNANTTNATWQIYMSIKKLTNQQ
jgi:hypothetical protein